ncbi:hypothetical protein NQ315_000214 [Exocentrus adspersus]|uniref:FAS1 domain-containing protein n=1 Tax=Exocentrus adspersus TaxID=1586481 RepID=A0AAV8VR79_9CUCU|nr:hypothetical protein NQ315_000214 [Exocentrus adspersus]
MTLSLGVEDGVLQAYNQDFELQFAHKVAQMMRFSQADLDPCTFLYLLKDDYENLLYCYLFQAKKSGDKLQHEPDHSGFAALVRNNKVARLHLSYEPLTVFAPETSAFDAYSSDLYADLAYYHMSFEVRRLHQLRTANALITVNLDNPPLWITVVGDDVYVNNAKVLRHRSDYVAKTRDGDTGHQQVLHLIDQVLDPKIRSPEFAPSAYDFLTSSYKWDLDASKTVHKFYQRTQQNQLVSVYKAREPHTYFIPLDTGIDAQKYNAIDRSVALLHVVPNHVLFTRPADRNLVSITGDEATFTLSVQTDNEDKITVTVIVKEGAVEEHFHSEIVVANIPVTNGVVHLISQPLGVVAKTLKPFPYLPVLHKLTTDPDIDIFYKMGLVTGFNKLLDHDNASFTYFVPLDASWKRTKRLGLEPEENCYDILAKHLVVSHSPYTMQQLVTLSRLNNYTDIQLRSLEGTLRFTAFRIEGKYYLKWEKKYIEVVRPDYHCSNGMVHVINAPMVRFRKASEGRNGSEMVDSLYNYWKTVVELEF